MRAKGLECAQFGFEFGIAVSLGMTADLGLTVPTLRIFLLLFPIPYPLFPTTYSQLLIPIIHHLFFKPFGNINKDSIASL